MAVLDDLTGWDESTDSATNDAAPEQALPTEQPQQTDQRQIQSDLQQQRQSLNTDQQKQTWQRMTGAQFAAGTPGTPTPKPVVLSAAPATSTFSRLASMPEEQPVAPAPTPEQVTSPNWSTAPKLTRPGVVPQPVAPVGTGEKASAVAQAAQDNGAPISQDQHAILTADVDYRHAQRRLSSLVRSVGMTPDGSSILAGALDSGDADTAHAAIDAHFSQLYATPEASSQTAQGQLLRDRLDGLQRQAHKAADGMLTAQGRAITATGKIVQTTPIPGVDNQQPGDAMSQQQGGGAPDGAHNAVSAGATPAPAIPLESVHAAIKDAQAGKKNYQFDEKTGVAFQPDKMADGLRQAVQDGLIDPDYAKQHEQEFQAAQDKYNALQKAAGGAQALKTLLHGGGVGAAFWAGSLPGAKGGALLGAAIPGLGETGIPEVIGGALGGLATGSIAAWGARKALDKLADYSDTIKSINASAELHPVLDAAGQLVAMSANAPRAISNVYKASQLARAAAEAAGQNGTTAAAKLAAKIVGSGAAGGATFETVIRPVFDYSKNAVLDQLGLEHDAKVESPTLQSIITNTALGILTAGHNIQFKTYSTGQVASILTRAQIRNAAGVPLDATMTPEQMTSAAQKIGLSEQQMQGVAQPLSKGEIDVFGSLGEQLKKMSESGKFEGVDVSNVTAKQAVIPKMGDSEGTPISTTSIETNPRMLETGREGLPEGAPAPEPTIKPANAREVTPSADQPGAVEPPPGVSPEPKGPAAEPQSTAEPESSAAEAAPDTQAEAEALQKTISDKTAMLEKYKGEGNSMGVALTSKELADAQNRLNVIQAAPVAPTPVAPPPGVPTPTEEAPPATTSTSEEGTAPAGEVAPPPGVEPETPAAADTQPATPAAIAKQHGIIYQGETENGHAFKDPETNGNLTVKTGDMTPEHVGEKLAALREKFQKEPAAVGEGSDDAIQKAIDEARNAPKSTTAADQTAKKLATAALKLHTDALKTLGHPEDFDYGPVNSDSGIAVDIDSKRIRIDLPKFSKAVASLGKKESTAWVKRAVAHEVIHVATLKYAEESPENREKLMSLLKDDDLMAHAKTAYGKEWDQQSDFAKAAEAARMLIEGPENLTEASYKFLGDFIKWLKQKLGKLSNDTRELIRGIEAKMGIYQAEQKTKEPVAEKAMVAKKDTAPATGQLYVEIGSKRVPFKTLNEASAMYEKARDATGAGSSQIPPVNIVDEAGKPVAHISYNGNVWEGPRGKWTKDTKRLFMPGESDAPAPKAAAPAPHAAKKQPKAPAPEKPSASGASAETKALAKKAFEGLFAAMPERDALQEAWDKYDDTGEFTASDLVDEVDAMLVEHENMPGANALKDAVEKYREEQAYDRELAGRGDMDTANDEFSDVVQKVLGGQLSAATPEAEQAPLPKDKETRLKFMELVDSMEADGIKTPEKVAAFLDEISPKLRKYAQSLWHTMSAAGTVEAGVHDWPTLFKGDNTPAKIDRKAMAAEVAGKLQKQGVPVSAIDQPETAPEKPRRSFKFRGPMDEHFAADPIVQEIANQGGLMSRSTAQKNMTKEQWAKHKGEWDDVPHLAHPTHNQIYKPNGLTPDEMAMALIERGLLPEKASSPELWKAIEGITKSANRMRQQQTAATKNLKEQEKQSARFDKDAKTQQPGTQPISVDQLHEGDVVDVNGEKLKVVSVDPDTFDVELDDHERYGVQHVQDGEVIYGQLERPPESTEADPFALDEEPKTPEPSALPTLRPGEKGTSELFQGGDAPFNLAGEAGVDWQRIADEKAKSEKDSAEAKAKQDRDQLDIFGGKPDAAPSSHDKSTGSSLETGGKGAGTGNARGESGVQAEPDATGEDGGRVDAARAEREYASPSGPLSADVPSAFTGGGRTEPVQESAPAISGRTTGDEQPAGSRGNHVDGKAPDPGTPEDVGADLTIPGSAEPLAAGSGDGGSVAEIQKAAPALQPEQEGEQLGAANPAQILRHIYDKAATEIEAAKDEMKLRGQKEKVTYKTDAVTNRANYYGQQAGNSIKLDLPEKKDREAMPFVIEAAGDAAKLQQFKADIAASADPKLAKKFEPIIDHAIADQARLTAAGKNHENIMSQNVAELKANGLDVGEVENYVTRKLDAPDAVKEALPNPMFSGGSGAGSSPRYFTKGRSFETLADAIKAGYPPISTDLADLDAHRIEAAKRMIFQKQMFDELKHTPSPTNGEPIIGDMQKRKLLNGETEMTVPRGYSIVQAGGTPLVIHNDFANVFRDLFGGSALRQTTVGRAAIKTAAVLKHGTLAIDTFHIGRMLLKMAAAGGGGPVTTRGQRIAWNLHKGRALLEYSDADLGRAIASGDITQQEADYAKDNRAKVEKLMAYGMNVGRVADNLMEQAKLHLPILSTLNDWIFGKLSRSAMLQSSLVNLERNLKNPDLSTADAYRQTAREMNEIFGNLQNQGILRNKTLQDISRLIFLAPNWTESQFRNEGRAYAQAGKAAYNAARGRGFRVGNSARIFAAGFVGLLVANQIINFLSRGQTTFQNPEDGHKLDAWIPGGKRGFWFDPLEIAGEYAHAAEKYTAQHENPVDVAAHIASNKLSPLARGLKEGLTGRDYAGRHFLTNADRLRATITDMVPIPLVSGAFFEKDPRAPLGYRVSRQPGSFEKQLLQSVGAKLTPAQSPRTQMFELAQPFRADRGRTDSAGEYTELRRAIDNDQLDAARSEIEWLQERGKSLDLITHAMGIRRGGQIAPELFTGSQDREKEMIATLTEKEMGIYQQAQIDHLNNAMKFLKLLKELPPTATTPKPALAVAKKSTFSRL